jgi:hypothetical protein
VHQAGKGIVIVCDADTIPEPEPLHAAVEAAGRDGRLHLPYTRYRALSPAGTTAVLNGAPLSECPTETESTGAQGGILVMDAEAWQNTGGMDERFTGWGFEDTAFHAAAHTLNGDVARHEGDIHHLWHPSDFAPSSPQYAANKTHWQRYEAALGDPTAMRRVQQSPT